MSSTKIATATAFAVSDDDKTKKKLKRFFALAAILSVVAAVALVAFIGQMKLFEGGEHASKILQRSAAVVMFPVPGGGEVHVPLGRIPRLVTEMKKCLSSLGASAADEELEAWACHVVESMSAPSRSFHVVQHAFDISVGADSIGTLAAFFHDIIYYSADGGLSPAQEQVLKGIITEDGEGNVVLNEIDAESDESLSMTMDIFGFKARQVLNPFRGLNEFLSAAFAVRCLGHTLKLHQLAQIVTCIEATIPFRGKENGKSAEEFLFERLKRASTNYELNLSEEDLSVAVKRAVNLANHDVENFSTSDPSYFLSNTWDLLPESHASLRHTQGVKISDYALALKKTTDFLATLDPGVVFPSFQGEPREEVLFEKTELARKNLSISLKYMHCKLLAICVLAALAEETGGDAPVAVFIGDIPQNDNVSQSIENYLPAPKAYHSAIVDEKVYDLLKNGRGRESTFDTKYSPLAAYLYSLVGDEGLNRSLEYLVLPIGKGGAKKLLASLPRSVVRDISLACAEISVTRARKLRRIAEEYSAD